MSATNNSIRSDGGLEFIIDSQRQGKVEMQIGKRRVDFGGDLKMDLRQAVVAVVKIQISQVVMRLEVPGIVFQAIGKTIECLGGFPAPGLEDA